MTSEIFAHRGASHEAPENTQAAFDLAAKSGAIGIETDVHLTKDGVPVIIHDDTVDRTTDGKGFIKSFTMDELKQLDAGSWFGPQFTGMRLLSLDEFLQWFQTTPMKLNIELKNRRVFYENIEEIVYHCLQQFNLLDRAAVSTFNLESAKHLATFKGLESGYLTSKKQNNLIEKIAPMNIDALHIHYRLLNKKIVNEAKAANIKIRVYTVNDTRKIKRCFDYGCDGIFTDNPAHAVSLQKKWQKTN
ncbi:glycerophosphodiester phosphodiesterase [Ornithinibacillus sp. 4-3]|uniref:Glycerophosphodiester phosphodiesterase n=1 Tax=Ornithinibacillus sp. 4-3 TaxID=3231488 RepID=A0AB39HGV0_9BACI